MCPITTTLADLVRINSVNPAYGDGGSEAHLQPLVEQFFHARGIATFTQEVFPGRHNVIAVLSGQSSSRRVVLEAHMDTVSIKGMTLPPFDPQVRDGRLYGRGAVDDKAGLAAMMHAVADVYASGIKPVCEVWLAAVVDEEHSFKGVLRLCEGLPAEAAIVAEPTELKPVVASKGVLRVILRTLGKAAHSAKPHLGNNAIQQMAHLLLALEQEQAALSLRVHPLLGPATLSVGVIRGGVQINQVPESCEVEVDRRLLPGETASMALARYEQLLQQLSHQHVGFKAEIVQPLLLVDEALETPLDAPVVQCAQTTLAAMGLPADACGVPFGSDASKLSRAGVPTIIFGPGSIDQAHAVEEYVELAQVRVAAEFYRRFILSYGC